MSLPTVSLRGKGGSAERAFRGLVIAAGALVLVILALVAVTMLKRSWPVLGARFGDFFTSSRWSPSSDFYGVLGPHLGQ